MYCLSTIHTFSSFLWWKPRLDIFYRSEMNVIWKQRANTGHEVLQSTSIQPKMYRRNGPMDRPTNWPTNQSTNQPTNRPNNGGQTNRWTDRPSQHCFSAPKKDFHRMGSLGKRSMEQANVTCLYSRHHPHSSLDLRVRSFWNSIISFNHFYKICKKCIPFLAL